MANRLSKEKARLIASEYCTNGYRKVDALLSAGYSKSYSNKVGLKLYDNDLVKQCIASIEASTRTEVTLTADIIIDKLLKLADIKPLSDQDNIKPLTNTDIKSALELLGKKLALWTDNVNTSGNELNITVNNKPESSQDHLKLA